LTNTSISLTNISIQTTNEQICYNYNYLSWRFDMHSII